MIVRKAVPGDERGIAEVHVASWRETYVDSMPASFLAALSVGDRAQMWAGAIREMGLHGARKAVFVAEEGGRIVGFAAGGPERDGLAGFQSELYAVYLLREFQGRGAGFELTRALARFLSGAGLTSMCLWVLEGNRTRRFYERIGGRLLPDRKDVELGGKTLPHVAYGWDDLIALAGR